MIKVNLEGFGDVKDAISNMGRGVDVESERMLDIAAGDVKRKMAGDAPKATGALSRSVTIDVGHKERVIYPSLPYGKHQSNRNYMPQKPPPVDKIRRWAEVVGATKSLSPSGGGASQAAFLIARKISREGYKATPFIKDAGDWAISKLDKWARDLGIKIAVRFA